VDIIGLASISNPESNVLISNYILDISTLLFKINRIAY
jgi:hypothetical protein